jgi:microcystin-dependent protein
MNANVTIPSTIAIHCPIGVNIVTTGYTFNSAGPVDAGSYQIFSGSGTITLTKYPQEEAWIGSAEKINMTNLGVSGTATIEIANITTVDSTNNPTVGGDQLLPVGIEMMWPSETPPARWLEEDGSAINMTTYESLYNVLGSMYGLNTGVAFTADNTTDTFTSASHGLANGSILEVRNSGGSLPVGLSVPTKYFVVGTTTDTFQLSTSLGGPAVNVTTDGTGTHSFHNQFRIPDSRGRFIRIWAHGSTNDPDRASRTAPTATGATISAGDHVGAEQEGQYTAHDHGSAGVHSHTTTMSSGSGGSVFATYGNVYSGDYLITSAIHPPTSDAGSHTHSSNGGNETRPINTYRMMIIKAY